MATVTDKRTRKQSKAAKPQSFLQKLNSQFNYLIHFRIHSLPYNAGIRDGYLSPRFLQELDAYNRQGKKLKVQAKIELARNRRSYFLVAAKNSFTSEEAFAYRAKAESCRVLLEEVLYKELDALTETN